MKMKMMIKINDKTKMKHLQLFEAFKKKNISIDDIIECIEHRGVIYVTIIHGLPENDPELPIQPLSVDEAGTVTVDINGILYEVELKNIEKIEWM